MRKSPRTSSGITVEAWGTWISKGVTIGRKMTSDTPRDKD
jgi:hypothetical protein